MKIKMDENLNNLSLKKTKRLSKINKEELDLEFENKIKNQVKSFLRKENFTPLSSPTVLTSPNKKIPSNNSSLDSLNLFNTSYVNDFKKKNENKYKGKILKKEKLKERNIQKKKEKQKRKLMFQVLNNSDEKNDNTEEMFDKDGKINKRIKLNEIKKKNNLSNENDQTKLFSKNNFGSEKLSKENGKKTMTTNSNKNHESELPIKTNYNVQENKEKMSKKKRKNQKKNQTNLNENKNISNKPEDKSNEINYQGGKFVLAPKNNKKISKKKRKKIQQLKQNESEFNSNNNFKELNDISEKKKKNRNNRNKKRKHDLKDTQGNEQHSRNDNTLEKSSQIKNEINANSETSGESTKYINILASQGVTSGGHKKEKYYNSKHTPLRDKLMNKLKAARFRFLNEQLYTSKSQESKDFFLKDPESFSAYHEGFQKQVNQWPINPVDIVIKSLKQREETNLVIADLGCGEAKIAEFFPEHKVHSIDLVALNEKVTACDMTHTPLRNSTVDIAVFCLSLMGTDLNACIKEANRILKVGGELKIAEVESRFNDIKIFISDVEKYGFEKIHLDTSYNIFYFLNFKKKSNLSTTKKRKLPEIKLKACLYKKR